MVMSAEPAQFDKVYRSIDQPARFINYIEFNQNQNGKLKIEWPTNYHWMMTTFSFNRLDSTHYYSLSLFRFYFECSNCRPVTSEAILSWFFFYLVNFDGRSHHTSGNIIFCIAYALKWEWVEKRKREQKKNETSRITYERQQQHKNRRNEMDKW